MKDKKEDSGGRLYWGKLADRIEDPVEAKNKRPDTTDVEIEFLKDYCSKEKSLLDLGAGSGLITNRLLPLVDRITAVEKFEGFTKFILDDPNMRVINADLRGFKIRDKFDIILCTGVGQCFPQEEMVEIYSNISDMIDDGVFISRMHCGTEETITFDSFSEELQTDYYAQFRFVELEVEMIKEAGFSSVEVLDFLPDSINVWPNSRHFYFVCKK
ncbi:MAG: hypothetical protein BM555_04685 [Crocinitomix sp. MedPE-SWsnd]|nr:MAG: hypothetical protein BM555_04685 [Crocinitomix sp. MedPE-SWsnd]